jgi:hypothetical protein
MLARLLLALFIPAAASYACTDIELPLKQVKRGAEFVFRGTITAQTFTDGREVLAFHVTRVWKGPVTETFEIPVNALISGCNSPFRSRVEIGSEFVIFAERTPLPGGEYRVGSRLTENAGQWLQELGTGRKPKSN